MKQIVIVDYGLGNLFSIRQALEAIGAKAIFSSKTEDLLNCDGILLPGVGAFGDAMRRLRDLNLVEVIKTSADQQKPILGVCLGLQLLFDTSNEFGTNQGLELIPGEVLRFPEMFNGAELTIPFVGWNKIHLTEKASASVILSQIQNGIKLYFVHSYYVRPDSDAGVLAYCYYQGFAFPAVIQYKNIIGIQGHPEKSSREGLLIYKNWVLSL